MVKVCAIEGCNTNYKVRLKKKTIGKIETACFLFQTNVEMKNCLGLG